MTASLARGGAVLVALLISVPAIADTPAPPAGQKALDPNQVICEKHEIIGSRLGSRRICKTRAEWAELRLQEQQDLEKLQTQRGLKGE